jgi:hypothetical protein
MSNQNILSEETIKIKTKVFIFAGVSLFIGLTKALPTKLSLIGLNFQQNEKILGWFILAITIFLSIHFIIVASLNISKYFKSHFINRKAKTLTGDTIGLTYDEIGQEYDRQNEYNDTFNEDQRSTLSDEADDIKRKIKYLEDKFDKKHITINNIIEILFNFITPIIFTIISIKYLYCFLIQ